jgi:broad specificity phosphatase PhoE
LNRDLIADLVEFYREDNKRLLALVDEKTRAEISDDPRWWEVSAHSDKHAEMPGAIPPHVSQVEDVAARAIRAILDLEEKLRGK